MVQKLKSIPLIISYLLLQNSAFAFDSNVGIWKNLNTTPYPNTNKNLVSGYLLNRVYYDNTYQSENEQQKYQNTSLNTKLGLNIKLNNGFVVRTVAKFENTPKSEKDLGSNQFFNNQGAYVDELVLNYNYQNISVLAGKFATNFGSAWVINNGIWVNQIAKYYEMDEKLGLGLITKFGDKKTIGEYVFGFSSFTNDRKNLDNSIFIKRDSATKSEALVGDTRGLQSNVFSADIYYQFSKKEKLSYHFAYSNLAINKRQNQSNILTKIDDQKSFALNINYEYPINKNILIDGFVEYVNINNLGGDIDSQSNFLTTNLTTYFNNFYLTIANAKEQKFKIGTNGVDYNINELSIGYKFDDLRPILKGLSFAIGYNQKLIDYKTNQVKSNAVGMLLKHKLEF
jgi:hypothetical protein